MFGCDRRHLFFEVMAVTGDIQGYQQVLFPERFDDKTRRLGGLREIMSIAE
jgi:hypothetical protein